MAVRKGVRLAPAEVVMAGAVAPMAGTPRAIGVGVAPSPLRAIGAMGLLVAVAIALQGVRLPDAASAAFDARRRGAVVRTSTTRAGPTPVRAVVVGRVGQASSPDARLLPSSAGSVGQEEVDGGRQDEGVVPAVAAIVRRASVALPIRAAVVALQPTRVGRVAVPSSGAEAIGAPAGVATKSRAVVLVVH